MATFTGQLVSIVFIGRQNPAILNHDFLLNQGILPKEREPFKSLFAKKDSQPFSEFLSMPVVASIRYDHIAIVVEGDRFQIIDSKFWETPSDTIFVITKKYFGELLKYTPMQVGGMNLNGVIQFSNKEEEIAFDQNIGIARTTVCDLVGVKEVKAGLVLSFPWEKGTGELQFTLLKGESPAKGINFNYEFKYTDIEGFIKNLDDFNKVEAKFKEVLAGLGVWK